MFFSRQPLSQLLCSHCFKGDFRIRALEQRSLWIREANEFKVCDAVVIEVPLLYFEPEGNCQGLRCAAELGLSVSDIIPLEAPF
jgi:hypothetical protein